MTLKRLVIILGIVVILATAGIMWLWQYAYSPQGRARVIIAQLKGDTTSLRGWMLQHHLIRPGFTVSSILENTPDVYAADEMAKLDHAVLPIVIEALKDEDYNVRMMAVRACGEFHNPLAIQPLVERLREAIRRYKTGKTGGDDPSYIMDSLIEIGPEAYGQLLELTKEDYDLYAQLPEKLADRMGTAAVPQIIAVLLDDSGGSAQFEAAVELGKLKDKRATDALIRQLNVESRDLMSQSILSLGEIADPKAIPAILKIFNDVKMDDESIRINAAGALARMGRDDGLTFLLTETKSPHVYLRVAAVDALGTNQIKGTLDALLLLLGDRDAKVRSEAVGSIEGLHDPAAIPALTKLLKDPNPDVRSSAAQAMEELGVKPPPASQPGKPGN